MPNTNNKTANTPAEPFTLIVFGASGDLTRRKLVPAVFQLHCQGLLPEGFRIVGFARSGKTDSEFRDSMKSYTITSPKCPSESFADKWDTFSANIHYLQGNYDSQEDFRKLDRRIAEMASARNEPDNRVYYLATPPSAFGPIVTQLSKSGLARKGLTTPWARVVIEKPFGRDMASARELNSLVQSAFDEDQIFHIDHYLGKETVQNIMVMRFANSIFEHIWSHDYIDHVQITVAESLSVGSRGGYYDQAGAIRDMVQNHMMHLLCLVAMEPPISLAADAIRNEKVKVLRSLRPIPAQCAANGVIRAQYTAGDVGEDKISAYLDTDGVDPQSTTETFVAFETRIDNWRWEGVPFYLRTGKCLPKRCTEISVHFCQVPRVLFNRETVVGLPADILTIRVQPDEGISLEFQAKVPGPAMMIRPVRMDFGYAESFGANPPDAYERLLLDAALGDGTLFTRSDEAQAAWEFLTPVIEGCEECCEELMHEYVPGTWGPPASDELLQSSGRKWHLQ